MTPNTVEPDTDRSVDLWSFALRCYALEQSTLLSLQQSARLHINDALAAAYALTNALRLDASRWEQIRAGRPRQVLLRVRRYRQSMQRSDPGRALALDWELELERWDLSRLARCFQGNETGNADGVGDDGLTALLSEQCDLSVDEVDELLGRLQRSVQLND